MTFGKQTVLDFVKGLDLGAIATSNSQTGPEVALVNFAMTDELELVFETIQDTRKCINLRNDPRVAFMAWRGDQTLQYEGLADELRDGERSEPLDVYFRDVPSALSHRGWPGLIYMRVRPRWLRLSRYGESWKTNEMTFPAR